MPQHVTSPRASISSCTLTYAIARCHRRHADRLREPDSTTLRLQIGPEAGDPLTKRLHHSKVHSEMFTTHHALHDPGPTNGRVPSSHDEHVHMLEISPALALESRIRRKEKGQTALIQETAFDLFLEPWIKNSRIWLSANCHALLFFSSRRSSEAEAPSPSPPFLICY